MCQHFARWYHPFREQASTLFYLLCKQPRQGVFCFRHTEDGSPKFFSTKKNPQKSGITHTVTSNGGHPLHHHSGRLFNSHFNGRTTALQTFTLWLQASALQLSPPGALQATYHHPSRQSIVKFDSLCSWPWSGSRLNQKKTEAAYSWNWWRHLVSIIGKLIFFQISDSKQTFFKF